MIRTVYHFDDLGRKVPVGSYDDGSKAVGGRIFYIDSSSDEVVEFYDAQGNLLPNVAVGDTPAYYKVTSAGVSGKDKYYIYDKITGRTIYQRPWGYKGIETGANSDFVGSGKTNTNIILSIEDTTAQADSSIWSVLKSNNQNNVGGCNDWYIPSKEELTLLVSSGIVSTKFMAWASVEYDLNQAFKKNLNDTSYSKQTKDYLDPSITFIAIRSF